MKNATLPKSEPVANSAPPLASIAISVFNCGVNELRRAFHDCNWASGAGTGPFGGDMMSSRSSSLIQRDLSGESASRTKQSPRHRAEMATSE